MLILILPISWAIIAYTTLRRPSPKTRLVLVGLSTLLSAWKINSLGTESIYELLATIFIGCISINDILYHECEYEFSIGFVIIALHRIIYNYTSEMEDFLKLAIVVTIILVALRFLKLHKIGDADIVVLFGMILWYQYDTLLFLCVMTMLTLSVAILDRYIFKGTIMCGTDGIIPLLAFFAIIDAIYYQVMVYYLF